jgi:Zn-dependent peptidase ImmA (M78 family)
MSSINNTDLFEQYYQNKYDYNTNSLNLNDIDEIKILVREKRVDYAQAPIGTGIFSWILKQSKDIRFELVAFDSEKIDGMLYIPTVGKERAYIILNANKPLANQIFAAAHEFYHYVKDYQKFRDKPYVCDFSMLKDVNEKKASRFAAELLLPEEALQREIKDFCKAMDFLNLKNTDFNSLASLIIYLTVKYQMPLKAVIYRLAEENYIENIDSYIENYEFIKKVLKNIQIFEKRVTELYNSDNPYVIPYSSTYQDMEKAFVTGNASRENILEDAKKLDLDMELIREMLAEDELDEIEDAEDDEELFSIINAKRG